jgi:hypothetical protein
MIGNGESDTIDCSQSMTDEHRDDVGESDADDDSLL